MSDELKELKAKLNKAAEIHRDVNNPNCDGCPYKKDLDCGGSAKADLRRMISLEMKEKELRAINKERFEIKLKERIRNERRK